MTFISYAQNNEDVMLWKALKHIENGFYVDVGANDPIYDSVTQSFYERGWRGVNIEPMQFYFERLCKERPQDYNVPYAVADRQSELILYEIPETGLSTIDNEIAQKHRLMGLTVVEQKIKVFTLNQILEKYVNRPIHFLKIDVEGAEKIVLEGLDLSRWRPWILIIEATVPNTSELNYNTWEPLVLSANYEMAYFDGLNRFYVAHEQSALAEQMKTPPNFFDNFISIQLKQAIDEGKQRLVQLNELGRKFGQLEVQRNDLQFMFDEKIHQMEICEADRAARLEVIYKQSAQYDQIDAQHNQLIAQHNQLAAQHNQLIAQHNQLIAQHNQLADQHNQLIAQHNQLIAQHNQLAAQHNQLADQHEQLSTQYQNLLQARFSMQAARLERQVRSFLSRLKR